MGLQASGCPALPSVRGRRSAESLATIGAFGVESEHRPSPPADFSKDEKKEWRRQVDGMPSDYFPPSCHPVLAQYVRHIVRARWMAAEIARMQSGEVPFDARKYSTLIASENSQSNTIKNLAAQMRLTQASTDGKYSRARGANLAKPVWSRPQEAA